MTRYIAIVSRMRDGDRAASKYRDARMNSKGRKHILAASRYSFDPRFESLLVDEATNGYGGGREG